MILRQGLSFLVLFEFRHFPNGEGTCQHASIKAHWSEGSFFDILLELSILRLLTGFRRHCCIVCGVRISLVVVEGCIVSGIRIWHRVIDWLLSRTFFLLRGDWDGMSIRLLSWVPWRYYFRLDVC